MAKYIFNSIIGLSLLAISFTASAQIEVLGPVEFQGAVHEAKDISGIGFAFNFLVAGADEGTRIQILKRTDDRKYRSGQQINLLDSKDEIDIEGIARSGDVFYVVGSHSLKRKKVDKKKYEKNRERIAKVEPEESRNNLFRLTIDLSTADMKAGPEAISLKEIISEDEVLGRFANIPSKENGIDIEGIAVDGQTLYMGFRGPVLRLNYVPIMVTTFDNPKDYELRYVNLHGRGIRDIAKVKDGFLIVAGPVGDLGSFQLYHWNGKDEIPGEGGKGGRVTLLGEIPTPEEGKAEGIAVLDETDSLYEILIVYDGMDNGTPTQFRVHKPR